MTTIEAVRILLGDRDTDDREQRMRLFADTVACFHAFNIRVVGRLTSALIVQNERHPYGDLWFVNDNGGEFNMGRLNSGEPDIDVPYTAFGLMLDGATMAYRIRCTLDGTPIDWSGRLADVLDALKAA